MTSEFEKDRETDKTQLSPRPHIEPHMVFETWPDGLSVELALRAQDIVNNKWTSTTEAVLHAHLLLEQALAQRIAAKFVRPTVLDGTSQLARLGFAQLLTVYVGLYDPEPQNVIRLRDFNTLRNRLAHTLGDPDELILKTLQRMHPAAPDSPSDRLSGQFFYLFLGELLGVRGCHWHDPDAQLPGNTLFFVETVPVCSICHRR